MITAQHTIVSLDLQALEPYRTLKRQDTHREQGIFVAEGEKVVSRLLESSLRTLSVLLTPEWLEHYRAVLEHKPEHIEVYTASADLLSCIVGYRLHQGIMAVGQTPPPVTTEALIDSTPSPRLLVAVENVVGAENIGVILRNCAACGVTGFIAGEDCADPYLRRAVRNSMGTVFRVPVVYSHCLRDTLRHLRSRAVRIVAAHPRSDAALVWNTDLRTDVCILLGNEGQGLSPEMIDLCDETITIPMAPGIDSFNVACAGAVVLYEAVRQRGIAAQRDFHAG